MAHSVDIYIAGLGIRNIDQMTHEVERAIRRSREVLYVDTGVATRTYLEGLCPRVSPLYENSYQESGSRLSSYENMAARVVEAALDHPPVVFAMGGHPVVGADAPFLIRDAADALDLTVQVLPGISAMDCLFADLMIDPCVHGLQMFEATDLLLRRYPLQANVPALIWQIGVIETRLHSWRRSKAQRFDRFLSHVLQFYAPSHPVTAVFSSPHPLMETQKLQFPLAKIARHAEQLHAGFTLYIPAAGVRPIEDADLLAKIDSLEHLYKITE